MTARQTLPQLREMQRLAGALIMRPLSPSWRTQRRWTDGSETRDVAAKFIKPNDRLTSLERIEIYNRQYWFRLIDILYEDFAGLRVILGRIKFNRLIVAYLQQNPSRCFTLRNLGDRLPDFIRGHPSLVRPHGPIAHDMSLLEWARIVAFDGPQKTPLTVDALLGRDPQKLRLHLQPFITLLRLRYPLNEFSKKLKSGPVRDKASNAMEDAVEEQAPRRRPPLPRPQTTHLVVHRLDNTVYFKGVEPNAFRLLTSLQSGVSLGKALAALKSIQPDQIRDWFTAWSEFGWFCE